MHLTKLVLTSHLSAQKLSGTALASLKTAKKVSRKQDLELLLDEEAGQGAAPPA